MASLRWKIAQFFERHWWRRYLRKKEKSDYLKWKRTYWKSFLDKAEVDIASVSHPVLDAGCGPAGLFTLEGVVDVAIDPLLSSYSKTTFFHPLDFPGTAFKQEAIENLSVEVPFATVFCMNAINHVDNLEKALAKLYQATEEQGVLYLSTDVHRSGWLATIFRLIPGDILHPHQYTSAQYQEKIKKAGWEITREIHLKSEFIFDYRLYICKKCS